MAAPSIINKGGITRQDLLCLFIQDIRYLMDLKLMPALLATHPHPSTRAGHLQFTSTLFTFHLFAIAWVYSEG